MDESDRHHFEERLQEERRKVLENLQDFDETLIHHGEDDGDLTSYPLHLADEGTDTMEQEKEYLLASEEGRRLYEINEALRALYREPERYGRCAECGRDISRERLEIVPWARLCIEDERKAEQS